MANTSISNLTAGAAVSATDLVPNVQTVGVGPVKTTAAQLKTFMSDSPTLVTPALGTPVSGNFSTGTFTWPTFNQNTTGTAAGLSSTLAVSSGGTGTSTAFTTGSVVFAGASGVYSQKNSNLFWDNTNNRLGVNTSTPSVALHTVGNSYLDGLMRVRQSGTTTLRSDIRVNGGIAEANAYDDAGGTYIPYEFYGLNFKIYVGASAGVSGFSLDSAGKMAAIGVYNNAVGATNKAVYVDNAGVVGYLSSIRASKMDIASLSDVNWLYDLAPVTFKYRARDTEGNYLSTSDGGKQYGLIAEDVEKVAPDFCYYSDEGKLEGVAYSKLITPLLTAIQNLRAEFDEYVRTHP